MCDIIQKISFISKYLMEEKLSDRRYIHQEIVLFSLWRVSTNNINTRCNEFSEIALTSK